MAARLLEAVPTAVLGVLVVGLAAALAVGGLVAVRRVVPVSALQGHNDVAGFIYAVLGVVYAVLVPFVLVVAWEEFRDAEADVAREAQTLVALRQDARQLGGPPGRQLAERAEGYARAVVEAEWPLLARGEESPAVDAALVALEDGARGLDLGDPRAAAVYGQLLDHLDDLAGQRQARVVDARAAVPGALWAVLLAGGALVVGYTYLYGVERLAAQALMTAALAAVVAMVLFVTLVVDHPFAGGMRVPPEELRDFLADGEHGR